MGSINLPWRVIKDLKVMGTAVKHYNIKGSNDLEWFMKRKIQSNNI